MFSRKSPHVSEQLKAIEDEDKVAQVKERLSACRELLKRNNKLLLTGYTPAWVREAQAKKAVGR